MKEHFKFAFDGIIATLKQEKNMKIHFIIMILVIICGFIFKISLHEWLACLLCFGLVISLEMINTAIEALCNVVDERYNERIGFIKDVAAGAVLFAAFISAIIGLLIFVPKLF